MHKIAFIIGDQFVYWTPIMIAVGVLAAVCMFLALHIFAGGKTAGAFAAAPLAIAFSLLLGRLVYWFCAPEQYGSLRKALTTFSVDGYALTGIVVGCVSAACFVRLLGLSKNLPVMLDTMSLAGLFGISVGKLNHFFNQGCRADSELLRSSSLEKIPFDPFNPASTNTSIWQATFLLQAIVYAVLFVLLVAFFLLLGRKKPGHTCLLAGLFYGAALLVLEGMRYDGLLVPWISGLTFGQLSGVLLFLASLTVYIMRLIGWVLDRHTKIVK